MSSAPFDRGRAAGRSGKPKSANPFDHPDRQTGPSMDWERKASEWDEGWWVGKAIYDEKQAKKTKPGKATPE